MRAYFAEIDHPTERYACRSYLPCESLAFASLLTESTARYR